MSGSEDSKIYLWDLQSREVMQVLEGHKGETLFFVSRDCFLADWVRFADVVVAVAVSVLPN